MTNSLMSTKHVMPALNAGVYMLPLRPLGCNLPPLEEMPMRCKHNLRACCLPSLFSNRGSISSWMIPRIDLRCSCWVRSAPPTVEAGSWLPTGVYSTLHGMVCVGLGSALESHRPRSCSPLDSLIPDAECPLRLSPQSFHDILEEAGITAEVLGIVVPSRRRCAGGFGSDANKERGARGEEGG
jgi:hypothetical protein